MSVFDLDKVFWTSPRSVNTPSGPRRVRTWVIPNSSPFWPLWKSRKEELKARGYTVGIWQGDWVLTHWLPDGHEREQTQRPAAQSALLQRALDPAEAVLPPALARRFKRVQKLYEKIRRDTGEDFSYQFPSIKRLALCVEAFNGGLDASDTGTGKTAVACAVALVLDRDLFVVCPKNVIPPWERMAELFGVRLTIINYEMLRTGNTEFGHWAHDTGTRQLRRLKRFIYSGVSPNGRIFVFDECHRMKDSRTQNCACGLGAIDAQFKVLALSATAADNPMHMKFIALLTGLIDHPNQFYGWMTQNGVSRGVWGLEFKGGRRELSRIHNRIFPLHGTRIRIADLGDRFPDFRIISESYLMQNQRQIERIYRIMREEIAKLERKKASDWHANVLVEQLRARQEVELLKVPTLVSMAEDAVEEGMNVVVILNYTDSITRLARLLHCTNIFTGETPYPQRQGMIDRFNADTDQLMVMNIKAGGLGIGLHGTREGRPRLALISPTFSGPDLKQAIGRFPRAAGATSIIKIVWAAGTIEEHANNKVRAKLRRLSIINDDELTDALSF